MGNPLQVLVYRGDVAESEHLVDAVVLNQKGAMAESFGEIERRVAPRSAIKPFQAMLLANSKWAEKDPRAESRLAISCSSHWGGSQHLSVVKEWLKDLKLQERDLACGPHMPKDEIEHNRLISEHRKPERFHNNCSGKHTGMLALCQDRGYTISGYHRYDHPVQQEIRHYISRLSQFDWDQASWGIDGCGIPTTFVPMIALASLGLIFFEEPAQHKGAERIRRAMTRYPALIAGEGSLSTWVIKETGGKILVKNGAEGCYWGVSFKTNQTFFMKVRDGADRAADAALMELLRRTGNFEDTWKSNFEKKTQWPEQNCSGTLTGKIAVN